MGTSGGAVTALLLAIHFPDKVRAIIADSFSPFLSMDVAFERIIKDRRNRTSMQKQFWEFAHGPDWEQVIEADSKMIMQFAESGGDWFAGRLNEIRCPVLLTASLQDSTFPKLEQKIKWMSEQLAECSVFLHTQGGHPLMWTEPEAFRTACDAFLDELLRKRA
jgi:pimeloyl-ACP methyl ester carboxylesterase